MNGWAGKRIRADLTKKVIVVENLPLEYLRKWIGGRGLNSEVVYHETKAGMDPFDPANPLCFGVGPLSGTFAPMSGRVTVSSRSPMVEPHAHGDTNMGGHWGPELKFAGYDQIIVKGKADKPVYLWIDDDKIELRDASKLWGKNTMETTLEILNELGDPDIKVACIGPGGERLIRMPASSTLSIAMETNRMVR
jgi:aldehyde:ferredoxin oxidoreductase